MCFYLKGLPKSNQPKRAYHKATSKLTTENLNKFYGVKSIQHCLLQVSLFEWVVVLNKEFLERQRSFRLISFISFFY